VALNFGRLMSNVKRADKSIPEWNYQREVGVELRESVGEPSIALASTEGKVEGAVNTSNLLERVLDRNNLNLAYKRVKKNKGSHGIDGMKVEELLLYLKQKGNDIKQQLLEGRYRPQAVRRVEIPKPEGGVRLLGIPTVLDRMIQQAISQVITPIFEKEFSNHSYGFRPRRNAHQAVQQAEVYINEGYRIVVDIDLEKFFDRVNHDKLMYLVAKRITDKRVLKLIRSYLESGVMIGGLVSPTDEGTPQGGPLSPLLSNITLHELDKELEKRGHRFCRYADDCNIYVKSMRAGERVMQSISQFIEKRLKLKINKEKSAVDYPQRRKFLGFSFYEKEGRVRIRVHPKSIGRLKEKLRKYTSRSNGASTEARIERLNQVIRGWVNYFAIADIRWQCQKIDEWLRRRIRMCIWKQWKKVGTRKDNLIRLSLSENDAWKYANTRIGLLAYCQ
jgi:group II intron reverse transcriptase/maturase